MKLDRIYRLAPGTASIARGLKCALRYLGICGDSMGAPLRVCTEEERRTIEKYIDELGLEEFRVPTTPPRQRTPARPAPARPAPGTAPAKADPRVPAARGRVIA